ncbi:hypothetical protein LXL04_023852 [Taraxacum kok-saghyz]
MNLPLTVSDTSKLANHVPDPRSHTEGYAKKRGINVLAELDVRGHAVYLGVGYPELWTSKNCTEPLDVRNEFPFKLINGVLSDFSKIFKYKFVHLGGDEVDTSCWSATPRIKKWLEQKGFNEETFNNFDSKLDRKTVFHNWNQDTWYLDHLDATKQQFYTNEQTIWPRAAAVVERLWTNVGRVAKDPKDMGLRLMHFRCLLNQRVAAAPLDGPGLVASIEPESCYIQ